MSATADLLASITTPDTVQTRVGTLEFDDGAPSRETAELLYDHLDVMASKDADGEYFDGVRNYLVS